jgi:putative peptide zinc metalloprotease protein
MVAFQIPILGALMALGGVITWAVVPVSKLTKYLLIEPELHRKRGRAVAFTVAVAAIVLVLIGLIKFPVHVPAEGIIEPDNKIVINSRIGGFVRDIPVKDGQIVKANDVLLIAEDPELDSKIQQLEAQLKAMQVQMQQASVEDQTNRKIAEVRINAHKEKLKDSLQRRADLTLRSPIDGTLVAPTIDELSGRWVPRGTQIGTVATTERLVAKLSIDQGEHELLTGQELPDKTLPTEKIELTIAGRINPDKPLPVTSARLLDAAQDVLPHASLGVHGGGEAVVDPSDREGRRALVRQFEVRVQVDNPGGTVMSGQRAYARFTVQSEPLLWQWWRRLGQVIQARAAQASELTK